LGHDWRVLGHDWRVLGHDWRVLGHDWRVLGHDSRVLWHDWRVLGHDWWVLGHDWRVLGHDWRVLGHVVGKWVWRGGRGLVDTGWCKERIDGERGETVWIDRQWQCAPDEQNEQDCCRVIDAQVAGEEGVQGGQATKIGVRSADKKWNSQA
jgi:hypothetical protein